MLSLVWDCVDRLIDVLTLVVTYLAYRDQARRRSEKPQRTRVVVRERVRELWIGRWIVRRMSVRREDVDRS